MGLRHKFPIRSILTPLFLLTYLAGLFGCFSARSLPDRVRENLRNRIERAGTPPKIIIGQELIHAVTALPLFYKRRTYQPAWSNKQGLLPQVDSLIKAISEADLEGLSPGDYHLDKIKAEVREVRQNSRRKKGAAALLLSDLDLLLTDAFLVYASHLVQGKVNPESIEAEWDSIPKEKDSAQILENSLCSNNIEETLKSLLPQHSYYNMLKQALASYRDLASRGGWGKVPAGPEMQKGDQSERVVALRNRLLSSSDLLVPEIKNKYLFDEIIEEGVRRFQKRHGLEINGIVESSTLAALNVPLKDRLRQIEVNMERWRWLPHDLDQRYIYVNIANFELMVIEEGQKVMSMKVVAGTQAWKTPVFCAKMTYLVLNPYWNAPKHVLLKELINYIRQDPNYLINNKMKLLQGLGAEEKEIDPKTINWAEVSEENLNFRLRQDPGPLNVLGRLKFMLPSKFNIYLHDTPYREDFAKTTRAFSHGCIRIEKPIDLAEYLLQDEPSWTREKIMAAIEENEERTVKLNEPVDVLILYCTTWVEEDGSIQFINDIYERDKRLDAALRESSPASLKSN